jgi:hypothetical protein
MMTGRLMMSRITAQKADKKYVPPAGRERHDGRKEEERAVSRGSYTIGGVVPPPTRG